jgi:hypothetical protein
MRQSAWLKRLRWMLRAKRPLVKLPYSCALVSSNHTHETDRRNQMDQIPATRRWTVHLVRMSVFSILSQPTGRISQSK